MRIGYAREPRKDLKLEPQLDESRAKLARRPKGEGEHSVEEICEMLEVGRSTLYRYLGEADGKTQP